MPQPFYGSTTNPVDTTAQVVNSPGAYEKVLSAVGQSESVDMLVAVTWASPSPSNDALIAYYKSTDRPVALTSTAWMDEFQVAGLPTYTDPLRAANALGALTRQSLRSSVTGLPQDWKPDAKRVDRVSKLLPAPKSQRALLESTSKQVLAAYGIPVTRETTVTSADAAIAAAQNLGRPIALKVMSYQLPHKTDAGAIRLGVVGADAVRREYDEMLAEVSRRAPEATIDGVLVQDMVPARLEMMCGLHRDPVFGAMVAVGLGGTVVEILSEAALLRPPFDLEQAKAALGGVLGGRLLDSARGLTPPEQQQMAEVMVGVGTLALEFDAIAEIDINPIRVADGQVVAADALIILR